MTAIDAIEPEVIEQIAVLTQRKRAAIEANALLSDLELDSLGIARLIAQLEHTFGIEFPQDHLVWFYEVNTVGELCEAVQRSYRLTPRD